MDHSFSYYVEKSGLPTDNKCYKVGTTLACGECLYPKPGPSVIDNAYRDYIIGCGRGNKLVIGHEYEIVQEHSQTCDHWNDATKDLPPKPHPGANLQYGRSSYCPRHKIWRSGAWNGCPQKLRWDGPVGCRKTFLRNEAQVDWWKIADEDQDKAEAQLWYGRGKGDIGENILS